MHDQNSYNDLTGLFAALILARHNVNMLHWGTKGHGFDKAHNVMEEYGDTLNGFIDDIAEIMMMSGTCIPSLVECVKILESDECKHLLLHTCPGGTFDGCETFAKVNGIFRCLMEWYDCAEKMDLPDDIISKLHEHHYWLRKEACYKGANRTNYASVSCNDITAN